MYSMLMLGVNETIDQLVMTDCMHQYCDVLRNEYGHVLKRAID